MNVFPSSSTKTLYLRSVRCRDRSSSITRRICSWFCAAYAACTTYRLVVMIIWNPLLSVLVDKAVLLPNICDNYQWAHIVTNICEIKTRYPPTPCSEPGVSSGFSSFAGDYPEPESQASDLRYRLLTSEDGGVPPGKLLEAGRTPSEQRLDDGRNLRFLALAPLAKKLGQRLGGVGRHSGGKISPRRFFWSNVDVANRLSGGRREPLCHLRHAQRLRPRQGIDLPLVPGAGQDRGGHLGDITNIDRGDPG